MVLIWLAACGGMSVGPPPPKEVAPEPPSYQLVPASVDLGLRLEGVTVHEVVRLRNTGGAELVLQSLEVPEGVGLAVEAAGLPFIAPGGEEDLVLSWTPEAAQHLDVDLALGLEGEGGTAATAHLPVRGVGEGPVITLSSEQHDFGEVKVGCTSWFSLTLTNTGNADLALQALTLDGDEAYTLAVPDLELPGTLSPFESLQLDLAFAPTTRYPSQALLELDAGDKAAHASFTGTGVVDGEDHLTFQVGPLARTTALIHVNWVALDDPPYTGTYATHFEAALPTFFQTLADNHVTYRVAFLYTRTGEVHGSRDYIDGTLSPAEATDAALEMLTGLGYDDNDSSFDTLVQGIGQSEAWLLEDEGWIASRLGLVAINSDTEQSAGAWSNYVTGARSYKDEDEDVVFHAIAGGGGCAEPYSDFDLAVEETGGAFLSVCDPDWSDHMAQIAAGCMEGAPFFQLDGHPLASTIEVWVDDEPTPEGWWYDEALNAVVFTEEAYPAEGSTVAIRYLHSSSCD